MGNWVLPEGNGLGITLNSADNNLL
jgi:hypothetical protein